MKFYLFVIAMLFSFQVNAQTFKIGVLAPEGTGWAKNLKNMASEIEKSTEGKVKFKIYFGGAQGDEPDVLRKIRIGQLHGGIFTGKTLGDINGDVRVMELPFTFYEKRELALATLKRMAPYLNAGFSKNKFENLGFFELGLIYFVSQQKTESIDALKGLKIWTWEGDPLVMAMIQEMNLVSVPLSLPDVLSSLSTGIIQAAYAPPLAIIALQWNTKIKYLVDFPLAYSTGAFLVGKDAWAKIPADLQGKVRETAAKFIDQVNEQNAKDNVEALTAIKSMGVEFLKFSDKDVNTAKGLRSKIIDRLKGKLFSAEALKKLEAEMKM
ncbi:MAG: hypothetical protein A2X86_19485 [Bdellovibrionales bacterium GWA2_49_15]|nr:MAG: hypothetical protein A2X86_19485 [Bdellovibrionales bacterium GWA2_49_15]HAZ14415.1 ABC transporter substrate-binding protein [Bdellovibrionales bacterium]